MAQIGCRINFSHEKQVLFYLLDMELGYEILLISKGTGIKLPAHHFPPTNVPFTFRRRTNVYLPHRLGQSAQSYPPDSDSEAHLRQCTPLFWWQQHFRFCLLLFLLRHRQMKISQKIENELNYCKEPEMPARDGVRRHWHWPVRGRWVSVREWKWE